MPGIDPLRSLALLQAGLLDEKRIGGTTDRNMFEDAYLGRAGFAKALVVQRAEQVEFLKAIGIVK